MATRNYYDVLQVHPAADPDVIEAAYKKLSFKFHPDRNKEPDAHERMTLLNEAYHTLRDPTRRNDYDALLRRTNNGETSTTHAGHQQSAGGPPNPPHDDGGQKPEVEIVSLTVFQSAVLRGIAAIAVEVQIAIGRGAGFLIVGLPKREVTQGAERLKNAIAASGFQWPQGRVTVNLAPAGIPKGGTTLDLAIALSILAISGQITVSGTDTVFAIGELNLDGSLRRCQGALSVGRMIPANSVLIAPVSNRYELGLLHQIQGGGGRGDIRPYVVKNLAEAVEVAAGRQKPLPKIASSDLKPAFGAGTNFREVKGQERAKRALEVAAAGGHNILLMGPPGEGKGLLANALPTILPRLAPVEIIELTQIYSAKGLLNAEDEIVRYRPFRPVHHGASREAIIGGGSDFPMPGELTLAHRGVLFLDELPEFGTRLLESLRQPLEDGSVNIARKGGAAHYPCQIILAAAMNPCPCGFEGEHICDGCRRKISYGHAKCPHCASPHKTSLCRCTATQVRSYRNRISGPIMDRLDLTVRVGSLGVEQKFGSVEQNEDSKTIRARVEAAREIQRKRFEGTRIPVNARIPGGKVDSYCVMTPSALTAMKEVASRIPEITTRGHDKLLKVARTIADLNSSPSITKKHICEAADLCGHDRVKEFLQTQAEECATCGQPIQPGDRFCSSCGRPQYSDS